MRIAVLGSGVVGQTLAAGFIRHGHETMMGTREPEKLREWQKTHSAAKLGSVSDAAAFAEVVMLAVKGSASAQALRTAGQKNLAGKIVIDATNPIGDGPPDHGVLPFFAKMNESLMEQLQREFADARLVKAFNSVGSPRFVNPSYAAGRPTMFICGNDETAKKVVSGILDQFGWEAADMGGVEAARAIEPLCMLWCVLAFTRNEWTHAFKLLHA
jgi:8-hydroxy-5-deazaflavin:NADPH oxidoreductase